MSFFAKISNYSSKRIIKSVLNHLIGQYLTEELTEDQISFVGEYSQCSNIHINLKVINDIFENQNIPINILYGNIGLIKIYLPWGKEDGKFLIEIHDLEISVGPTLRNSSADPEEIFNCMLDSMLSMRKNLTEDKFSGLFQETVSGKNFNKFLTKCISKFCFKFERTRINFESRPLPHGDQICRFVFEIDNIYLQTRDNDSVSETNTAGVLLRHSIEMSDIKVSWEVASQNKNEDHEVDSINPDQINTMLYGAQILSITGNVDLNYSILINSSEPEIEINSNIQQIHILLSPLQIHWLQLLISQCLTCFNVNDPSLARNIAMTESQFESFFPVDDRASMIAQKSQYESVYYDVPSSMDNMSIQSSIQLDDVPLDNSDDDDVGCGGDYDYGDTVTIGDPPRMIDFDQDTCISCATNITLFDKDGKISTNIKLSISISLITMKILLQDPNNDLNYLDVAEDYHRARKDHYKKWMSISRDFFSSVHRKSKSNYLYEDSFKFNENIRQTIEQIHGENKERDYLSVFAYFINGKFSIKKVNEKFHRSIQLTTHKLSCSEVLCKSISYGLSDNSFQLINIEPTEEGELNEYSTAIKVNIDYNCTSNELTLEAKLGNCQVGIDLSIQDRLRPILDNDILQYFAFDNTNSYEFTNSNKENNNNKMNGNNPISCIFVINMSSCITNIHVPIVNLDKNFSSWQYRMLHSEYLQLMAQSIRILIRTTQQNSNLIEIYSKKINVSLRSENMNIPVLILVNDKEINPMICVQLKKNHQNLEDTILNEYQNSSLEDTKLLFADLLLSSSSTSSKSRKKPSHCKSNKTKRKSYKFKPYTAKQIMDQSQYKTIYKPASNSEVTDYMKRSIKNSAIDIEVNPTQLVVCILNRKILEILYHRLCFDIVLWESNYDKASNNIVIDCHHQHHTSKPNTTTLLNNSKLNLINITNIDSDNNDYNVDNDNDNNLNNDEENDDNDSYMDNDEDDDFDYKLKKKEMKRLLKTKNSYQPKKFTLTVKPDILKVSLQSTKDDKVSETICWCKKLIIYADSDEIMPDKIESQNITIVSVEQAHVFQADYNNPNLSEAEVLELLLYKKFDDLLNSHQYVMMPQPMEYQINTDQEQDQLDHYDQMLCLIMDTQLTSKRKSRNKPNKSNQLSSTIITSILSKYCIKHFVSNSHSQTLNTESLDENNNQPPMGCDSGFDWLFNLIELLSLDNPVISGYTMPDADMVMHFHMLNGCIDLKFAHSPMSILAQIKRCQLELNFNSSESYSLNSDICFSGTQMFIKHDDFDYSFKTSTIPMLKMGYVFVADLGNFDIKVTRLSNVNYTDKDPITCKFQITNTVLNIHVCKDSLQLILTCLSGLLFSSQSPSSISSTSSPLPTVSSTNVVNKYEDVDNDHEINKLITDAIFEASNEEDDNFNNKNRNQSESVDEFDEFLIIDEPVWNKRQYVRNIDTTSNSNNQQIRLSIKHDHFKAAVVEDQYTKSHRLIFRDLDYSTLNQSNLLGINSLLIHDFSIALHFYAGFDFSLTNKPLRLNKDLNESHQKTRASLSSSMRVLYRSNDNDEEYDDDGGNDNSSCVNNTNSKNIHLSNPSNEYNVYLGRQRRSNEERLTQGGSNRLLKQCYKMQLSKMFLRYDDCMRDSPSDYSTSYDSMAMMSQISRRLIFIVSNIELVSRNQLSEVNKNLFRDSESQVYLDLSAPMMDIRMNYYMTNTGQDVLGEECDIKCSFQPLRLNIDQELVSFLETYYEFLSNSELSSTSSCYSPKRESTTRNSISHPDHLQSHTPDSILVPPQSSTPSSANHIKISTDKRSELQLGHGGGVDSIYGSSPLSKTSTARFPAFDELACRRTEDTPSVTINTEECSMMTSPLVGKKSPTVFIRSFSLFPDISVRLDYNGTRMDLTKGFRSIFLLLMQLNNVELKIKRRRYLEGITGFDNLINLLIKEIMDELYSQLSNILIRLGPMAEISDIVSGVYDFFNIPYQHYRNQDSIVQGLKLGTRSITTSSLWATLTLFSKGIRMFQKIAEATYELTVPLSNQKHPYNKDDKYKNHHYRHDLNNQIRSVACHVPVALTTPVLAACEATTLMVDNLRYHLKPHTREDDNKKWK